MVELEFTLDDMMNIAKWYELAFAKKDPEKQSEKEKLTFHKVSAYAQMLMKEIEDDKNWRDKLK